MYVIIQAITLIINKINENGYARVFFAGNTCHVKKECLGVALVLLLLLVWEYFI